ncbi:rho guanine nucleotide exchange factor 28-like isoform X2 [Oscarella lobularis]|uniref:rho guanine nucleotide exchange factor 28-like isoform X2 n=1 Tax=Oscarella lobularis TaxID=121494 RepID=UPI003313788B
MDFSPRSCSTLGNQPILITFVDDDLPVDANCVDIWVVFRGASERHEVTATRINASTVKAIIPPHSDAENVSLSICYKSSLDEDFCLIESGTFCYYFDATRSVAEFLFRSVSVLSSLDPLGNVDLSNFALSAEAKDQFDAKLSESFGTVLKDQIDWSLLGPDEDDETPRETLLHFAARLGLCHFAETLMTLPGAQSALEIRNRCGELPRDVASEEILDIFNRLMGQRSKWAYKAMRKGSYRGKQRLSTVGDEEALSPLENSLSLGSPAGSVIMRQRRSSSKSATRHSMAIGEKIETLRDSVFAVEDGEVVLDLKPRKKHHSIPLEETRDTERRSRSALPQLDNTVSSLEDTMLKLRKMSQDLQVLKEKNKQILKNSELSSMAALSASCPSLLDDDCDELSKKTRMPMSPLSAATSGGSIPDLQAVISNANEESKKDRQPLVDLPLRPAHGSDSEDDAASIASVATSTNSDASPTERDRDVAVTMETLLQRVATNLDESIDDVVRDVMEEILNRVACTRSTGSRTFRFSQSSINEHDAGVLLSVDSPNFENVSTPKTPLQDVTKSIRSASAPENCIRAANKGVVRHHSRARSVGEAIKLDQLIEAENEIDTQSLDDVITSPRRHSLDSHGGGGGGGDGAAAAGSVTEISSVTLDFDVDEDDGRREKARVSVTFQEPAATHPHSESEQDGWRDKRITMPPQFFYDKTVEGAFLDDIRHPEEEEDEEEEERGDDVPPVPEWRPRATRVSATTLDYKATPPFATRAMRKISEEEMGISKSSSTPNVAASLRSQRGTSPEEIFRRERQRAFRDHGIRRSETVKTDKVSTSDGEFCVNPKTATTAVAMPPISDSTTQSVILRKTDSAGSVTGSKRRFTSFLSKRKGGEKTKSVLQRKGSKMSVETETKEKKKDSKKHKNQTVNDEESSLFRRSTISGPRDSAGSPASGPAKGKQKPLHVYKSSASIATRVMEVNAQQQQQQQQHSPSLAGSKPFSKSQGSLDTLASEEVTGNAEGYELQQFDDPGLDLVVDEENWQITVDKKILKKLGKKEVARQELIHELILTERRYLQAVKVLRLMFGKGMIAEVGLSVEAVDEMMPKVNIIEELSSCFCQRLKACQNDAQDVVIFHVGSTLVAQFCGESGKMMEDAYSFFCSRHLEAIEKYKELLRANKHFRHFVEKTKHDRRCRRLDVPEHLLLISQRLSKYNSLLNSLVKQTKDRGELKITQEAYDGVKRISYSVDQAIEDRKGELRLSAIQSRLEIRIHSRIVKSMAKKLKRLNLQRNGNKLVYENSDVIWRGSGGKEQDVIVLLTSRLLVFLVEKDNEKYNIATLQDISPPVIQLKRLMSRSVATDSKAMYLITTGKSPEMYTVVLKTKKERERFNAILVPAIEESKKSDEVDGLESSDSEDERKTLADDTKSLGSIASLASPPPTYDETVATSDDEGKGGSSGGIVISDEKRQMLEDLQCQLKARDVEMESIMKAKMKIRGEMRAVLVDSGYSLFTDQSEESLLSSVRQVNHLFESRLGSLMTSTEVPPSPVTVTPGPPSQFHFSSDLKATPSTPSNNAQDALRQRARSFVGPKSSSAEPDIKHAGSGMKTSSTSKVDRRPDLLDLPRLVRERWRPASHGSGDKTPEKYRKKSAPHNAAPGVTRGNSVPSPYPSSTTLSHTSSSDTIDLSEGREDVMGALSLLSQTVETILTKFSEQQTEIEQLRNVMLAQQGADADIRRLLLNSFPPPAAEGGVTTSQSDPSIPIQRTPSATSTKSESPFGSPRPSPRSMSPGIDILQAKKKSKMGKRALPAEN